MSMLTPNVEELISTDCSRNPIVFLRRLYSPAVNIDVFGNFREKVGVYQLSLIFKRPPQRLGQALKKQGLVREIYTFVDSAKIVACVDKRLIRIDTVPIPIS